MFSDEKCSLEDFALWIEAVMDHCFKVHCTVHAGSMTGLVCHTKCRGVSKRVCTVS